MTVDRSVLRSRIAAVLADACNAELNVPAGAPDACQPDSHADDARAVVELIEPLLKITDAARPTILASQATRRRVIHSQDAWYAPGRWVAQYHDPNVGVWFDIGDPHDTYEAAETVAALTP